MQTQADDLAIQRVELETALALLDEQVVEWEKQKGADIHNPVSSIRSSSFQPRPSSARARGSISSPSNSSNYSNYSSNSSSSTTITTENEKRPATSGQIRRGGIVNRNESVVDV